MLNPCDKKCILAMPMSFFTTSTLKNSIVGEIIMSSLIKGMVPNNFNPKIPMVATGSKSEVLNNSNKHNPSETESGLGRVLTRAISVQSCSRDLSHISSGLGRVPIRAVSLQSNPKRPIDIYLCLEEVSTWTISMQSYPRELRRINSGLGRLPTRVISVHSNPTWPIEIYSGFGEVPTWTVSAQSDPKCPIQINSGLQEALSAQLNPKGSLEINCILGRRAFHNNCMLSSKGPYSRMGTLRSFMCYQTRAISLLPQKAFAVQSNLPPEYQMPTVTWGAVVQGNKDKLASRAMILDYLRSLGVVPAELEDLELPSTIDVMKERVEFLRGIGLSIKDINEYPLMLGCSVRKNLIPVLEFLYRFGIQKEDLPSLLRRFPQVLHSSVVVELVPIIKFLRGLDIEKTDIPFILRRYPELLGFKLEGTMSTSVAYLVNIGVNPRDIGPMLTEYPEILGMRVGTVIKPFADYLMSLGFPKQIIARMIEKRPRIVGYDLEEIIKPNVQHLLSFGVRREALASVIAQYPEILGLRLKPKLDSQQHFFKSNAKVRPEDFGRLLESMPHIVSLPPDQILRPIHFLRGRGFMVEDVAKMIVARPQLLVLDVESMKLSFYYYKTQIKRPLQELVEFPDYFTYSLEWRIRPRFQKISSKGIKCSLAWFLNCSDRSFEERLDDNDIEIEETGPSFSMGGALQLPEEEYDSAEEREDSDEEMLYTSNSSISER